MSPGYALFDTAIGRCGIAWSALGIDRVQLPEQSEAATQARLLRGVRARPALDPGDEAARAVVGIVALAAGDDTDLSDIPIDLHGVPDFHRRVYDIARGIARGRTLTYGEIAARLGEAGAARAVGQALGRNPVPILVPCHRVLAAHGKLGGFSAHGGAFTKRRLLAIEGGLPGTTLPLFAD